MTGSFTGSSACGVAPPHAIARSEAARSPPRRDTSVLRSQKGQRVVDGVALAFTCRRQRVQRVSPSTETRLSTVILVSCRSWVHPTNVSSQEEVLARDEKEPGHNAPSGPSVKRAPGRRCQLPAPVPVLRLAPVLVLVPALVPARRRARRQAPSPALPQQARRHHTPWRRAKRRGGPHVVISVPCDHRRDKASRLATRQPEHADDSLCSASVHRSILVFLRSFFSLQAWDRVRQHFLGTKPELFPHKQAEAELEGSRQRSRGG